MSFAKNSTPTMLPSLSLAVAFIIMDDPARMTLLSLGEVMATSGGVLQTPSPVHASCQLEPVPGAYAQSDEEEHQPPTSQRYF